VPILIPPTYSAYEQPLSAEPILKSVLDTYAYSIIKQKLPEKLLAVHSGFAVYGRNNITFHPDWGSFIRYQHFVSDLPVLDDNWQPLQMADLCANCNACVAACPTGAISNERMIIDASKCLTFYNEQPDQLPDWIEAGWFSSLIGCLKCQVCCPMDTQVKKQVQIGPEFTEEETELLLQNTPKEEIPAELMAKLQEITLDDDIVAISRNLKCYLESQSLK
jgi:epoxyqueuosine reductase